MGATPILGSTADGTGQDGKEKKHSPIRGGAQQWRAQRLIRALATVSTEDSNPLRDWTDGSFNAHTKQHTAGSVAANFNRNSVISLGSRTMRRRQLDKNQE